MDLDPTTIVRAAPGVRAGARFRFRLTPIVTALFALAFVAWCWGHR